MHAIQPAELLRHAERSEALDATDAALLARFVANRDATAFAELVRRHGALVLGVCRRVTGHPQDAEDAFQAVFLTLAQKSHSLRNPALLGNWLYGVAFRIASRAKRSAARRRKREVPVSVLPETAAAAVPVVSEIQPIVDEELAALPGHYRDAVLLCDIRGVSREEAAAALGIPEGTLSSRLANGRKKLADRLTRRGVSLSLAVLPTALSAVQAASAVPPQPLVAKTCEVVSSWCATGAVPASLSPFLTGGFVMKQAIVGSMIVAFAVAGAVIATQPRDTAPPETPKPPATALVQKPDAVPVAEPKPAEVTFTKQPKMRKAVDVDVASPRVALWNRSGTHLGITGSAVANPEAKPESRTYRSEVRVINLENLKFSATAVVRLIGGSEFVGINPAGDAVLTAVREYHLISGKHEITLWKPDGTKRDLTAVEEIPLSSAESHDYAFATDGKSYRTIVYHRDATGGLKELEIVEFDLATGNQRKSFLKVPYTPYAFSPNGTRFAVFDTEFAKVTVFDVDRGAKLSEHIFAGEKLANASGILSPISGWGGGGVPGAGGFGGSSDPAKQPAPTMVFSPKGDKLIVSRAIGDTVLLDTQTGKATATLAGLGESRVSPKVHAFTNDGRLIAMAGTRYVRGKALIGREPKVKEVIGWVNEGNFVTVWDTQTGEVLKSWPRGALVAFCPTKPLLAVLESNSSSETRVGFWDFAEDVKPK